MGSKKEGKKEQKKERKKDHKKVHKEVQKEKPKKQSDNKEDKKGKLRLKKKVEKTELLSKVPKQDVETGRSFNKAEIRRMMKRVKRGLPAIPTKDELEEMKKEEARIKREADSLVFKDSSSNNDSGNEEMVEKTNDDPMSEEEEENDEPNPGAIYHEESDDEIIHRDNMDEEKIESTKNNLKKNIDKNDNNIKTKKPVPKDYVCQACQNKNLPPHWIYNCPDKVTRTGCNQKKKPKTRTSKKSSSSCKVFISGLPFDITNKELRAYFKSKCCEKNSSKTNKDSEEQKGFIRYCKLLTFQDSNRCNGQAEVIFQTKDITEKALELHGTVLDRESSGVENKKSHNKKKNLTLSITKVVPKRKYQ